ncbi:hypothetical protein [Glycomyces buryatensis]|uniref:DUF4064 domain-containing protein n=1 Tax=Glycomyces buryatensis TaxID=2570927 RepID=A0A4S8Q853_9ACTN|nr:hypothetical protein [Glycomyces buryatensis]THV37049.1 hypothetical protein FAB82_21090 [Glycomyces buryatensis]
MLPQPNFGPNPEPAGSGDEEVDGPPKQLRRLRIAIWVQVVFGVLAGNLMIVNMFSLRQSSTDELVATYTDVYVDQGETQANAVKFAQDSAEYFHSSSYLTSTLVIGGLAVVAAVIGALCAVRLKTRLKAVRWWAVGATAVLFIIGMLTSTSFGLMVAPWVFASVLALWWLFARDVRQWLNE